MKTTLKATALIAALAAAGSAAAMTVQDNGGQFGGLVFQVTNDATSPNAWATQVRRNHDNPNVTIIGLSELGASGAALNSYLDATSVDLSDLHRAIQGQPRMASSLFADGFSASDVVAYTDSGKDNVQLIVDDIR